MIPVIVESIHHRHYCLEVCEVNRLVGLFILGFFRVVAPVAENAMLLNVGFEDESLYLLDVFTDTIIQSQLY